MGFNGQVGMGESHSPMINGVRSLWDHLLAGCLGVGMFVMLMMKGVLWSPEVSLYFWSSNKMELLWTVMPAVVLVSLALPSLHLLYVNNQLSNVMLDINIVGRQWYWTYEVLNREYEMYCVSDDELEPGDRRTLEVDNPAVVPSNTPMRISVTSGDVIHAWNIPILAVKADAVPGRVNTLYGWVDNDGLYHGGCAEICGVHHSHIPTVVEAVSAEDFFEWVEWTNEEFEVPANGTYFQEILDSVLPCVGCEPHGGIFFDDDPRFEYINKVFSVSMTTFENVNYLGGEADPEVVNEVNNMNNRCQKFYYLTMAFLGNYLFMSRNANRNKIDRTHESLYIVEQGFSTACLVGWDFLRDVHKSGNLSEEQEKEMVELINEWENSQKELANELVSLADNVNESNNRWWEFWKG